MLPSSWSQEALQQREPLWWKFDQAQQKERQDQTQPAQGRVWNDEYLMIDAKDNEPGIGWFWK